MEETHLWQLSRTTTARAFAIGLYCAMLPVPGQMIISTALAIVFSANIPLSFSLIFITNPVYNMLSHSQILWESVCTSRST